MLLILLQQLPDHQS